ncbi:MAG: hypothetical protein HY873_08725 [Chloroflexi bacterium]|nr:hypothetical protein [Chloroflexota bacterium]
MSNRMTHAHGTNHTRDDGDAVDPREVRIVDSEAETLLVTGASRQAEERLGTTWWYESLPGRVNAMLLSLLLALESLLTFRFALVAVGARRSSGLVNFIHDQSYPFVRPFQNAFADRTWDQGIIEVSTLLAMGAWLIGFGLIALLLESFLPHIRSGETRVRRSRVTHY